MKIMEVVYSQEKSELRSHDESASYMGEESWIVGEVFKGKFIQGKVTEIYRRQNGDVMVEVDRMVAMSIPPHAVQRVYYGEE